MSWQIAVSGHAADDHETGQRDALRKAAREAGRIIRDADVGLTYISITNSIDGTLTLYSEAISLDKLDDEPEETAAEEPEADGEEADDDTDSDSSS